MNGEAGRKNVTVLALLFQLAVLLGLVGWFMWILRTGEPVTLISLPVDPRSPLQGDYLRLSFNIDHASASQLSSALKDRLAGSPVRYDPFRVAVALNCEERPWCRIRQVDVAPPRRGPWLWARAETEGYEGFHGGLRLYYGLEQYYVQQGQARLGSEGAEGFMQPLQVRLRVRHGEGVIESLRPMPVAWRVEGAVAFRLKVQVRNVGQQPLTWVGGPWSCHFQLRFVALDEDKKMRIFRPPDCETAPPVSHLLKPGDTLSWQLDVHGWRSEDGLTLAQWMKQVRHALPGDLYYENTSPGGWQGLLRSHALIPAEPKAKPISTPEERGASE